MMTNTIHSYQNSTVQCMHACHLLQLMAALILNPRAHISSHQHVSKEARHVQKRTALGVRIGSTSLMSHYD